MNKTLSDPRSPLDPQARKMRSLLEGFARVRERVNRRERVQAADQYERFRALLSAYHAAVDRDREQQKETADDFNLLDVLQFTGKETRHSMVLASLLDHDLRNFGTHAQGSLGFRLFLGAVGLPSHYAECQYTVRREIPGEVSVIDVEVACRGQFLIHIENKIWSGEGPNQTTREWADVQGRAERLGVQLDRVHALFLTPDRRSAANQRFKPVSWRCVARVMEQFADQAKPPDVKLFAAHYARVVGRFIAVRPTSEDDHGQETVE